MIKYKKMLLITGVTLLMLFSSFPAYSQATPMSTRFGTNFSEDFALVFDLNAGLNPDSSGVHLNVQVLEDLFGTVDPTKVNPVDQKEFSDQQFFMAHFNSSGMNTIYLALNKLEFNLSVTLPLVGDVNLGHVNGSSPFQSLLQYFTVFDKDVFVANTFRGYLAYDTTANDSTIGPGDNVYLGYTMVETNFINFLNNVLDNHLNYTIPAYGFEPIYRNTATEKTFGMNYTNFFVVWQDVKPTNSMVPGSNFDQVVTGGDIRAASVFDYLTFTYKIIETPINATHTTIDVVTEYDVGPMSLLITRDDSAKFGAIETALSDVNGNNSFNTPATTFSINLKKFHSSLTNPTINVPSLSFYTGNAVQQRIDAAAVKEQNATGFGLAVASSTNVIVVGETVNTTQSVTDDQDTVIPLTFGNNNTVFETSFKGKSTYDRTLNNGTVETGLPISISTRSPSELSSFIDISSVATGYFEAQSLLTGGLAVLSAKELNPDRFGSVTGPGSLNLRVDQTEYITFVQMPKWSGLEVTQDPSFSAVAAVSAVGSSTSNQGSSAASGTAGTTNQGNTSGAPGFEFYAIVLVVIPWVFKRKLFRN